MIFRSTLHVSINALPAPLHYPSKNQGNRRFDNRNEIFLIEEIKPHRGWEASQPLKSKSIRSNHDLILPTVPGGIYRICR